MREGEKKEKQNSEPQRKKSQMGYRVNQRPPFIVLCVLTDIST